MKQGVTVDFGQSDMSALLLALGGGMCLLSNKFQSTLHQLSIEGVPILLDKNLGPLGPCLLNSLLAQ